MAVLTSAQELPGEAFIRRAITVVLALITALTFAFGFGNVWALGRSLGVPALIAPLIGPAVDLSVAGLLLGLRHLSMTGIPRRQLRSARILLATCGAAELALNIAGPVAAGAYGRAAFDAVGPLLLIGWAEAGPGLLRHLYASPSGRAEPPVHGVARADDNAPGRIGTASRPEPANGGADQRGDRRAGHRGVAGLDDLLVQARGIDQEHRARYGRPVSAETLRKQMRIGSMRARGLVQQVRRARQPDRDPSPDRHGPGPLHRDGSLHSAPVRPGEHMAHRQSDLRKPVWGWFRIMRDIIAVFCIVVGHLVQICIILGRGVRLAFSCWRRDAHRGGHGRSRRLPRMVWLLR